MHPLLVGNDGYLDTASNGFYYQLEGNQGWKKKVDSDGDFAGTHHHYHNIPSIQGQKPMVTAVPLIPHLSYQPKARNQKAMNTNPPQRFLLLFSSFSSLVPDDQPI
ncbi:hypothetical protein WUBG_00691 [Wuchereria bancrofti]|uniref:Uncharacterized protein n=1 Tax=Wuchereria bancrofti TaxID=6293 RepID=J9F0J4_WUCBA|nr:hypothetical protein WUBG_00691 [Wuchereria bancrofti]